MESGEDKLMGGKVVYHEIWDIFKKKPNLEVTISELEHETGLTRQQVMSAIMSIRKQGGTVESAVRGYSYVYRESRSGNADSSKRIFEEIGVSKSGAIVIQDQNGTLYKAVEIE